MYAKNKIPLVRTATLLGIGLAFVISLLPVQAQDSSLMDLAISLRSSATAWPKNKGRAEAEKTRKQPYAFGLVRQGGADSPLVRPVDPMLITKELAHQLDLQGFTKVQPGQQPEILISAEYGRGWLPNPYDPKAQQIHGSVDGYNQLSEGGIPTYSLSNPMDVLGSHEAVRQRKWEEGRSEKLFIVVRAWRVPSSSNKPPKLIWTTMTIIDDPAHRDLNGACKEMLAAAAPYFGRPLDDPNKPEIYVSAKVPAGQVDVGDASVVQFVQEDAK